jgi:hypothetical protein
VKLCSSRAALCRFPIRTDRYSRHVPVVGSLLVIGGTFRFLADLTTMENVIASLLNGGSRTLPPKSDVSR